jgi:hypothetical protein
MASESQIHPRRPRLGSIDWYYGSDSLAGESSEFDDRLGEILNSE